MKYNSDKYTYYITGTRRGLGHALEKKYGNVNSFECDVFINCKYDMWYQADMLYLAAEAKVPRIINIGSMSNEWYKGFKPYYKYGIAKKALKDVNDQLFHQGVNTTCINFGYFESESTKDIDLPKMKIGYCVEMISFILNQPYRIKEITVCK